jgi:hypothetical protein
VPPDASASERRGRSVWNAIIITAAGSFIGLVGLQLLFGALPAPDLALLWLGLALLLSMCLLASTRPLVSVVAQALSRLPGQASRTSAVVRATTRETGWLIVATAYLVLIQAILRHPLVAAFGQSAAPFLVEATFAIFALLVLLVLLGWMYRAARPLVEGAAREALDATFVTAAPERPEEASSPQPRSRSSAVPELAATVVAPIVTPASRSETTVLAADLTDRTQARAEAH